MTRRLPAICTLLAALLAPLPHGLAQMGLDRAIVASESLSAAQTEQIARHVSEWAPRLADEDPRESRRAREQLLQPLRERTITVAFRQAYSQRLAPELRTHAQADDDRLIVNAMRIAGELATPAAVQILEQKLQDAQVPVRYSAVANIGAVFAVVRDFSPAIGPESVQQLISRLEAQLQRERDPIILDATLRSLATALDITRANYENIRPAAFSAITRRIGERARMLDNNPGADETLRVFLRAAHLTREALADLAPRRQLGEQGMRQAAEMNGHLLAAIVRRLQAGGFPQDDADGRYIATQLVTATETTIIMAAAQLRTQVQPRNLAAEFAKATNEGDRQFRDRAMDLLGTLTRPPFNFNVDHFGGR